ncbi:MAG: hypothetical protein KC910_05245 [Candidatus Eremiobacteraeota bacterium]|nr:hypothetical protein [Candidatus Eremiobacteraeota bacterium]
MRLAVILTLWLLMAAPAFCQEANEPRAIPAPESLVTSDAISLAVVEARTEDKGFQALLQAAWEAFGGVSGDGANPFLKYVLRAIQIQRGSNALASFLPVQCIRVDSLGEDGRPHPMLAVTVAGWPSLQEIFYSGLTHDSLGAPYPTKDYEAASLVLREGWEDPTRSRILTRYKRTFISFPTVAKGELILQRLDKGDATMPDTRLTRALVDLDRSKDTYGAIVNQKGSLLKFLYWLNKHDTQQIIEKVGKDRLNEVLEGVELMAWEGDLVDDNTLEFLIRFETNSQESREAVKEVLLQAREVLEEYGRAGALQVTGIENEVIVNFTMLGYRDMITSYIKNSF